MPPTIVILTGSELRHHFFRKWMALAKSFRVLRSYCEGSERSLQALVRNQEESSPLRTMHLLAREQSERDFFALFLETADDRSNPVSLAKGEINSQDRIEEIAQLNPDLIVAYGCSIVKPPLLGAFEGRVLNVHLGLSPHYRGSGTNYWPLVNGEPEFVGVTFMHMDAGIDTGEIVHQIVARIAPGDTPAQIGNRLIVDMARACREIAPRFHQLPAMPQPAPAAGGRFYRKKDFTENSVSELYASFASGLVERFLLGETARRAKVPLVRNPAMEGTLE